MKTKNRTQIFFTSSIILAFALYLISGTYSLESGQKALVVRFGEVVKEVSDSGIHYCLPWPVAKTTKVYTSKVQTISIREKLDKKLERLTGDENLIVVNALISYDIKDLFNYLYKCRDVKGALQSAGQMCLTRELTRMTVDGVMNGVRNGTALVDRNLRSLNVPLGDDATVERIRELCPATEEAADLDIEVASQLLMEPELFARTLEGAPYTADLRASTAGE